MIRDRKIRPRSGFVLAAYSVLVLIGVPARAAGEWKAGRTAFEAGDYRAALSELQEVIDSHPDYAPGYHLLGRTQFQLGAVAAAIDLVTKSVELAPERVDYRLRLAQYLIADERFDRAFATLQPLETAPIGPSWLANHDTLLVQAALGHSRPQDIVSGLEHWAEARNDSALLHQAVARLHQELGAPEEAFESYRRAYQAEPRASIAQRAIAVAARLAEHADSGQGSLWLGRAAEMAEVALEHEDDAEMRRLAARLRFDSGDFVTAEAHLRRLLAAEAGSPAVAKAEVMLRIARCAIKQNELYRAVDALEQAAQLASGDRELERRVHESLAYVHHELGNYPAAIASYRLAGKDSEAEAIEEALASQAEHEARRMECLALEKSLRKALDEASAIRGTPDWTALEKRVEERLEPCQPYL